MDNNQKVLSTPRIRQNGVCDSLEPDTCLACHDNVVINPVLASETTFDVSQEVRPVPLPSNAPEMTQHLKTKSTGLPLPIVNGMSSRHATERFPKGSRTLTDDFESVDDWDAVFEVNDEIEFYITSTERWQKCPNPLRPKWHSSYKPVSEMEWLDSSLDLFKKNVWEITNYVHWSGNIKALKEKWTWSVICERVLAAEEAENKLEEYRQMVKEYNEVVEAEIEAEGGSNQYTHP